MTADEPRSYSIQLRIRRTTVEDAFIGVPVTDRVLRDAGDGTARIDPEALYAEARRIAQDARVEWQTESRSVEPHELQIPKPDDRSMFDAIDE
jgi:hypothetical protein